MDHENLKQGLRYLSTFMDPTLRHCSALGGGPMEGRNLLPLGHSHSTAITTPGGWNTTAAVC